MASSYDNDLRLNEQGTGDNSGSWGTVTNLNLEIIAEAFSYGTRAIANASTDNITLADGASDADRSMYLKLTGGGQACTVTFLPATISKVWLIENATSATLTFTQGSGANVAVLAGQVKMIATDGAGSGAIVYDLLTDVNLAGTTVMADVAIGGKVITMTGSAGDTATLTVAANGALAIATTDAAAAAANISITADGTFTAAATTITLDSAGAIVLDADGGVIQFKDGGTTIGSITNSSSDLVIKSNVQDKDILLQGDDGGTGITALTLDMSAGGNALFSGTVTRDLTRGSLDVGNSSGVSAPLAKGGANTVLTSDGTDLSWVAADPGAQFAGATVTITGDTTLANSQKGYLFQCTSSALITLPASTVGMYFIIANASTSTIEISGNNNQLVGGTSAIRQLAVGGAVIVMGTGSAWQLVGVSGETQGLATTYTSSATHSINSKTKGALVCVFGATASSSYGAAGSMGNRGGGTGGGNYSEKFIASPASSYSVVIGAATSPAGSTNNTSAGGITCGGGAAALSPANSGQGVAKAPASAGSGGDVNFVGGNASALTGTVSGGGGGSASRAGNGGNASSNKNSTSGTTCGGGGTGGNAAPSNQISGATARTGAGATSRDSNTRNLAVYGVASETWAIAEEGQNVNVPTGGMGLPGFNDLTLTLGATFRIGVAGGQGTGCGRGARGGGTGGYQFSGSNGAVTIVEFFENE